jgi:RNA polymerase sigma-70 factor (ECF subfamily)
VDHTEGPERRAAAIGRMMDAYGAGILRLCCLYLKDYPLAEDAAQETFLRAYRALNGFRGQSSEKTWLTRIAINVCKNLLRSPWRRLIDWKITPDQLPEPSCELSARDGDVLREVMRLPVKYREAILLYYDQELSLREIALLLNLPQATVSTRLSRARAMLKDRLKEGWLE